MWNCPQEPAAKLEKALQGTDWIEVITDGGIDSGCDLFLVKINEVFH